MQLQLTGTFYLGLAELIGLHRSQEVRSYVGSESVSFAAGAMLPSSLHRKCRNTDFCDLYIESLYQERVE